VPRSSSQRRSRLADRAGCGTKVSRFLSPLQDPEHAFVEIAQFVEQIPRASHLLRRTGIRERRGEVCLAVSANRLLRYAALRRYAPQRLSADDGGIDLVSLWVRADGARAGHDRLVAYTANAPSSFAACFFRSARSKWP
jgi:hypothetical protein